jgi:hypothetical protein
MIEHHEINKMIRITTYISLICLNFKSKDSDWQIRLKNKTSQFDAYKKHTSSAKATIVLK